MLYFDRVTTYMEVVGVFLLMLAGTYVYTLREPFPLLPPFVVLACSVILAGAALYKHYQRALAFKKTDEPAPRGLDTLPAGCVWIVWLLYGIVFRGVAPLVTSWAAYVHGGAVVALVLTTYWKDDIRDNGKWAKGVLTATAVLLFIPHPDTIGHDMHPALLFGKVGVFYLLFLMSEIALKLEADTRRARDAATSIPAHPYAIEIQVVQSAWVLLTLQYLMVVALAQIFLVLLDIGRQLKRRSAASELPTRGRSAQQRPAGEEGGGGEEAHGQKKRRRRRHRRRSDNEAEAAAAARAEHWAQESINNAPISIELGDVDLGQLIDNP
jgi:hypothetical protein